MSDAVSAILSQLNLGQISSLIGADEGTTQQAATAAIPALLGGLQANANAGGAESLLQALGQHSPTDGQVDASAIDTNDGAKIAANIFGGQQEAVVNQLGSLGGVGSGIIQKILPLLAPVVMGYVLKQVQGKAGGGLGDILGQVAGGQATQAQTPAGGGLGDILGQVLGSAAGGSAPASSGAGNILGDVLGGLLGGGRK